MPHLSQYLEASAARRPDHPAVADPGVAEVSYREFDELTNRLRDHLRAIGVRPGDRIGVCLPKSIDSVAALFGAQKAGAVHVPVDSTAPVARNAYIFRDCAVRAVVVDAAKAEALREALGPEVALLALDFAAGPLPLRRALEPAVGQALDSAHGRTLEGAAEPSISGKDHLPAPDDLAYILYTSGSTGQPKGVSITQRNATAFIDWCSDLFAPRDDDRFSSHAPFHFDLSVLDIYVPLKHGATVVLVSEANGKEPMAMAELIAKERITVWYSAPSILALLCQFGHLERHDYSVLRLVLFAGEVFPIRHLRELKRLVPHPRYFNLYGPTETNVCTWYEVPASIEPDRTEPYPIGRACAHYRQRVVDVEEREVAKGEPGELWISGPGVMQGYWNLPERNADVFRSDPDGTQWYRTGDLVVEPPDGELIFHGRRDRMVKKRGYRIELGEIEAALYRHPEIKEAAVVARPDEESGVRIRAFLAAGGAKLSIIRLKQFCAENLLSYMIPDEFIVLDVLPKTSTSKTDYQALKDHP